MHISDLVKLSHDNAKEKGFWDKPREFGTLMALIHSEVTEALEAHRNDDQENIAEELADIMIRVADVAGGYGIDLEGAIVDKMSRNSRRPKLHGKNY